MTTRHTVLLDNEAAQALTDPHHRKHRHVLAVVEGATPRKRPRAGGDRIVVPTAVRAEAGWDRRTASAVAANRLPVTDHVLDRAAADLAANTTVTLKVSVADAHLAAAVATTPGPHVVVTSDVDDVQRIAEHLDVPVRIVRI